MSIEAKKIELYQEFRQFRDLSEEKKLAFKTKVIQEVSQRSETEKEEYRQAIKANVLEIKEKILEIKEKIDRNSSVSV
jgi:hypothetical protein